MVKWLHGTKVPWCHGSMVSWYGTMVIAVACRCLDVWGAACRCLGHGVPMSGAWRADVWGMACRCLRSLGVPMPTGRRWCQPGTRQFQLVPAGASWYPAGTSWYQRVPAGAASYQVGSSGYQLAPQDAQTSARHASDIGTPCLRHRHAMPQTSARRAPDLQTSARHGNHHGTIP